jgi:hypothetical protein
MSEGTKSFLFGLAKEGTTRSGKLTQVALRKRWDFELCVGCWGMLVFERTHPDCRIIIQLAQLN